MEVIGENHKKKPSKIEEMTRDQIRQAILKKRECNTKSQYIVESLLERDITAEYLLKCLPEINQSHFDDVIEERSILYLCGYPICQNKLSKENIPKQQYRISIKTNKVYDITARKHFCSNTCYKSAMHLKKQMLTSPLWFREYEEIAAFHLLPLDSMGSMGLEVDVAFIDRVKVKPEMKSFISINDFATASFSEITHNSDDIVDKIEDDKNDNGEFNIFETADPNNLTQSKSEEEDQIVNISINNANGSKAINIKTDSLEDLKQSKPKLEDQVLNTNFIEINHSQTLDKGLRNSLSNIETTIPDTSKLLSDKVPPLKPEQSIVNNKPVRNLLNIVGEIVEKPGKKIYPINLDPSILVKNKKSPNQDCKKRLSKKQPAITTLTVEVEKCLAEWFTLDTLLFLFGEEKVKEMVADKGISIKEYLNNYTKSIFHNSNAYDQYQALCKKLNMLELEDRRHDVEILQRETKPLPDYRIIQEESQKMQLKVKAFLSGELDVPEPETVEIKSKDGEENVKYLPLVDTKAQNALRRKIVCEQLNKTLPDILRSLKLDNLSIGSDIRLIVNTFKLKPNNIMFKPIQWTLIAIIFIKLLSLRDERLGYLLTLETTTYRNMQLLLLSYKQEGCYLERLISWLTHIDRLLDTHDIEHSAQ